MLSIRNITIRHDKRRNDAVIYWSGHDYKNDHGLYHFKTSLDRQNFNQNYGFPEFCFLTHISSNHNLDLTHSCIIFLTVIRAPQTLEKRLFLKL